jgi:hypothetical protein
MAKEAENNTKPSRVSTVNVNHSWLYGVAGLLVLLVVFMAGAGIANHHRMMERGIVTSGGFGKELGGRRHGLMAIGGNNLADGQNRTTGVVTAVNGSSFTLAGHGSTTNVTTNSSTQYQGGNTVKQNDTVAVFGTTSNNTLTATQVIINP